LNRRTFIAAFAQTTIFSAFFLKTPGSLIAKIPLEIVFNNKLLKISGAGQILESTDNGATWETAADFGPDIHIKQLFLHNHTLAAQLQFHG